jgi:hypothetical protein
MIVKPDEESAAARGPNFMDLSRRRASAEAGLWQAGTVVAALYSFWNETSPSP